LRSFWKGSIGFGLVSIPVKAYRATEEHGLGLHQVHAADGGRIRLRRFCELDDAEVPAAEVGRAAETGGGDVVLITEEDLATLPVPTLPPAPALPPAPRRPAAHHHQRLHG